MYLAFASELKVDNLKYTAFDKFPNFAKYDMLAFNNFLSIPDRYFFANLQFYPSENYTP